MLKLQENPLFLCYLCIFPCNGLTQRAWDLGRRKQNFSETVSLSLRQRGRNEYRVVLREGTTCIVVRTILFRLSPSMFYRCSMYSWSRRMGRSLHSVLQACRMGKPDPEVRLLWVLLKHIFRHSVWRAS